MKYTVAELIDGMIVATIKACIIAQKLDGPGSLLAGVDKIYQTAVEEQLAGIISPEQVANIKALAVANFKIFNAVDAVMNEVDDHEIAKAAKTAQSVNLLRSKYKKAIDEFFENYSKEVKI